MKQIFKFETPKESTGFLLWKVTNLWQREIRKMLKKFDLTHTQFVVLASTYYLSMHSDALTQVEIANHIDIDKMMTSNVLRTLEKKGLIERKEHETDTRAKIIRITKAGIKLLKPAVQAVEEFDTNFFGQLTKIKKFNTNLSSLLTPTDIED